MRRLVTLAALLTLTACAVPEARLRTGLRSAGLSKPLSACMAERMVDRLSLVQLHRMADLPAVRGASDQATFLRSVRALRDPEILAVTTSSAAICATGLAR